MTDYWIQVDVGFPSSKLVDLARSELAITTDVAIAKFVRLWIATMKINSYGKLADRSDTWIEEEVGWAGTPGAFAAFVRARHLDSHGVIKEWAEKYGDLEHLRIKARDRKRVTRSRRRVREGKGQVDTPGDVPRDKEVDTPYRPEAAVVGSIAPKASEPPSTPIVSQESAQVPAIPAGTATAIIALAEFMARWDFGRWRDTVEGYIRASRKPKNVMIDLELHLTGEMHYKKQAPAIVGYALNSYAASADGADGYKPNLFAGYIRGAYRAIDRAGNATANDNETAAIKHAEGERQQRERDEREQAMLNDFERTNETRFEELRAVAERSVEKRYKGETRAIIVRGELIALVSQEKK